MQRTEPDGVILSCDFCGRDWDGEEPMIEGHHGSILCLPCLERALNEKIPGPEKYTCTLCLRTNIPANLPRYTGTAPRTVAEDAIANISKDAGVALVCEECIVLAAKTFSKSPRTDWTWPPPLPPPPPSPPHP